MLIKFGDYNINYKYIYLVIIFNFLTYYVNDGNLSQLLFPNIQTDGINNETISNNGNLSKLFFPDYTEDSINDNKTIPDNGNLMQLLFSNQIEDRDNDIINDTIYISRPDDLYVHPIVIDNLNFLGVIIISFILHKIREKKSGIYEQDDENIIKAYASEMKLISFLNFFIFNYIFYSVSVRKIKSQN